MADRFEVESDRPRPLKGGSQSLAVNILKRFIQTLLEDGDLFCLLSDPLLRRVQDRF